MRTASPSPYTPSGMPEDTDRARGGSPSTAMSLVSASDLPAPGAGRVRLAVYPVAASLIAPPAMPDRASAPA